MRENGLLPTVIRAGKANLFLSDVFASAFVNATKAPVELYACDGSIGAAIGAGLGGGSSDASYFIRLLNQKFGLGMENSQMESYASKIGSDCAFFIQNKPAYAIEKGDQLSPLDLDLSNYFFVLVMPDVQVSTAEAYQGVRASPVSAPLTELIKLPIEDWKLHVKNDFEPSVFSKYPAIARIKAELYGAGALYASMSGSGSSVYGIFKEALKLPQLEKENKVYYVID
ncbi:MAG: hypothetical protein B7Y76_14240 [Sphingobacteriia bacterium 35-40-5]|nr:MAG: hypothetical protein B7Y76_14240 [Sphingobacteriia bacterium 35-40-5]